MIRNFSPNEFSRLVLEGIESIRYRRKIKTRGKVYDFICEQIPSLTSDVLRNWTRPTHHKNPVTSSELSQFAELCLTISPDLGVKWVENLFARNGSSSRDMSDSLSALYKKNSVNQRQKSVVEEGRELLESYRVAVIEWAQHFKLSSGIDYKIGDGFIHSKIRRDFRLGNSQDMTQKIRAEELLQNPHVKAGIISVAGAGKSMLWQHLTELAAHSTDLSFPIPIDSTSLQVGMGTRDVIYNAIRTTWPTCIPQKIELLIDILDKSLEDGNAIALVDNWRWTPEKLRLIFRWKRVICFARQPATHIDTTWEIYNLGDLERDDIWQLVHSWPLATGMPLNANKLLKELSHKKFDTALFDTPLLLDLTCVTFARHHFSQWQSYNILKQALIFQTEQVREHNIDPALFRAALADFALNRLRIQEYSITNAQSFYKKEALHFWISSEIWKTDAEIYLRLAQECGILRSHENKLVFSHPMLHATLAAQAWSSLLTTTKFADWYAELESVKYNPRWADVIVFVFSMLSNETEEQLGRYSVLINFLNQLCSGQSDISESNWLLAGRCLSSLSTPARTSWAQNDIIQKIGNRLILTVQQLVVEELDCQVYIDVLLRMFTVELGEVIGHWVSNQALSIEQQLFWIDFLGQSADVNALNTLCHLSQKSETNQRLNQQIFIAIGTSGLTAAISFLKEQIEIKERRFMALDALVAHNSMEAAHLLQNVHEERFICGMSNPDVLPFLAHALDNDPTHAKQYVEAIGRIGGDQAVSILETILRETEFDTASIAAKQLSNMGMRRASTVLVAFLSEAKSLTSIHNFVLMQLAQKPFLWDANPVINVLVNVNNIDDDDFVIYRSALQKKKDIETRTVLEKAFLETHDLTKQRLFAGILSHLNSRIIIDWLQKMAKVEDDFHRIEAIINLLYLTEPSAIGLAINEIEHALIENGYFGRLCAALYDIPIDRNNSRLLFVLWDAMMKGVGQGENAAFNVITHLDYTVLLDDIIDRLRVWGTRQGSQFIRGYLFELLSRVGTPRAVEAIIQFALPTASENYFAKSEAVRFLSIVRNLSAIETLLQALLNSSEEVRYGALYALTQMDDENIIPYTIPLVSDKNESVVYTAFQTLQQLSPLSNLRIAQSTITHLQNQNPNLRRAALMVLEKSPAKIATRELLIRIEQILMNDEEVQVRRQAMITLGRLGKERSQDVLIGLIQGGANGISSIEIAQVLLEIGDGRIAGTLNDILKDTDRELWHQLVQPRFLCGLIAKLPRTKPLIIAFCLKYNVHIMIDGTVIDSNDLKFPCEEFQERMLST